MKSIGERISHIRKARGFSQKKLANLVGISIQFLSDIENNKKSMTVKTLKHIAESLNVTTDYIIYGIETENRNCIIDTAFDTFSDAEKKKIKKILEIFISTIL
ncbi:MAG: helix-turn-helix domain-containing protein [Ruminococcus flavefaciens]|nr:helix-turn-helix domain-containing protein [Ruminococcus flavefaciens]MCM1061912.1 helix-turn-helix domain-containing protein [Eubacterium sp.]